TGRSNAAIAGQLYLSERAIEKHISSLFQKLNLPPEGDVNRRVSALLTFLKATRGGAPVVRLAAPSRAACALPAGPAVGEASPVAPVRVLVVDDHELFRRA